MSARRKRYVARRFCEAGRGGRPDCFELYDTETGDVLSPGCYRYEAEEAARRMNREPDAEVLVRTAALAERLTLTPEGVAELMEALADDVRRMHDEPGMSILGTHGKTAADCHCAFACRYRMALEWAAG